MATDDARLAAARRRIDEKPTTERRWGDDGATTGRRRGDDGATTGRRRSDDGVATDRRRTDDRPTTCRQQTDYPTDKPTIGKGKQAGEGTLVLSHHHLACAWSRPRGLNEVSRTQLAQFTLKLEPSGQIAPALCAQLAQFRNSRKSAANAANGCGLKVNSWGTRAFVF